MIDIAPPCTADMSSQIILQRFSMKMVEPDHGSYYSVLSDLLPPAGPYHKRIITIEIIEISVDNYIKYQLPNTW